MTDNTDTIAAIATGAGAAGVGIVRVSGPLVPHIGEALLGKLPAQRVATLATVRDPQSQATIDQGIALYFAGPHSFTGEDILEFQGHGGTVILGLVLEAVLNTGARLAMPGEFSQRAFLNNKIDLVQAEAIADLIESGTKRGALAAQRSLAGQFSDAINAFRDSLIKLRVFVESAIDFADEEIDFLAETDVTARIKTLQQALHTLLLRTEQGKMLTSGLVVAIAGPPNAGKSSLLNALAGEERAIVTDIAGTTRDAIREHINVNGYPVQFVDTAGIRDTDETIERLGIHRSKTEIAKADVVIWMTDIREPVIPQDIQPDITVYNKSDLTEQEQIIDRAESTLVLSVKTGAGLDQLQKRIIENATQESDVGGEYSARARHIRQLQQAQDALNQAEKTWQETQAGELLAEELRLVQQHLDQITGKFSTEDLLGEIFTNFCIGK